MRIQKAHILNYVRHLQEEERSIGTIEKYRRDILSFLLYSANRAVDKQLVADWKEQLVSEGYSPKTVNSMLAAVHGFLRFLGFEGCQVKYLKVQRKLFREPERDLNRDEYERLISAAEAHGKHRLSLLIETICATGKAVAFNSTCINRTVQ